MKVSVLAHIHVIFFKSSNLLLALNAENYRHKQDSSLTKEFFFNHIVLTFTLQTQTRHRETKNIGVLKVCLCTVTSNRKYFKVFKL